MENEYWSYSVVDNLTYNYVTYDYVNVSDKDAYYYEYHNGYYSDEMILKYKTTVKRMSLSHRDAHPID